MNKEVKEFAEELRKKCYTLGCNYKDKDGVIHRPNYWVDEIEIDNLLKEYETKPQTNRQWLESLSDKDFAEKMWNLKLIKCNCCIYKESCYGFGDEYACASGFYKWLQAEHKDNVQVKK